MGSSLIFYFLWLLLNGFSIIKSQICDHDLGSLLAVLCEPGIALTSSYRPSEARARPLRPEEAGTETRRGDAATRPAAEGP